MRSQRMMWIVWPAFLMAGVLEVLVFAVVDPQDLQWFGQSVPLSRQGVYTVAFFVFWLITLLSSGLTTWLARSAFEINRCPLPGDDRPQGCSKPGASQSDTTEST